MNSRTSSSSSLGSGSSWSNSPRLIPSVQVNKKNAHCAMFIRMKFEEEENYLMYMYPDVASSNIHAKTIEQLKGVFHAAYGGSLDVLGAPLAYMHLVPSTQNHSLQQRQIQVPPILTSRRGTGGHSDDYNSLKASMDRLKLEMNRKQNLIVTYKLIHEDLMFILVLPHTHELFISNYMESLFELLKFTCASIDAAINDTNEHSRLDALFSRFFDQILRPSRETLQFLNTFSFSVPTFPCSFGVSQLVNNELNMLESSFHSKDLMKTPHACFILGACLFHSGVLISSHLSPKLTKKIVLFLQVMSHLQQRRDSPETSVVQEIFYEEKKNPFGLVKPKSDSTSEAKKRYLLVILMQGSQVLCSVLALRSHALSQQDPYFINEMKLSLQRMHTSHVFGMIDQQMQESRPPLADPASLLVRAKSSKAARTISHTLSVDQNGAEILSSVTTGTHNVLFNYVINSQTQGSLIFPVSLSDNLKKIEPQFIKYCSIIRQVLNIRRQQMLLGDEDYVAPDSTSPKFTKHLTQREEEPIVEYAIHVEDSESFAPQSIGYWVVGAMLPIESELCGNQTEIYVCYEDSIPQNVVEIAYRMATSII